MNLESFGQKLCALRKRMGLTQAQLARQLSVASGLISVWERAYQHKGRTWVPERQTALHLVEVFAEHLNQEEAQAWLYLIDLQLGKSELQRIFSGASEERQGFILPVTIQRKNFEQIKVITAQPLFGVNDDVHTIADQLEKSTAPWTVAIDGIGGIGKTSLAIRLTQQLMSTNRFFDVIWISAKQEEFLPGIGLQPSEYPEFTIAMLLDNIIEQIGTKHLRSASEQEKEVIVRSILKRQPYLVIIDNLEEIADYQNWIPRLNNFANPSKFLLTSRHRLHIYPDIFCHTVQELTAAHVAEFLRYEAQSRGILALTEIAQSQLDNLYQIVGGNPLALKLIVGQMALLPLAQVLGNLVKARVKTIEDLYTHIYWQAWQALSRFSRKLLLTMPLAQGGDFAQIAAASELDMDQFQLALAQLVTLSLVTVYGDLENRRYTIHRLTETFLLNEVIKW